MRRLAEAIYLDDRDRYLGIVRSALFELPSEVEETALHWRASRLEEHGYPTWDEALSIYAPPERHRLHSAIRRTRAGDGRRALAAPRASLRVLGSQSLDRSRASMRMTPEERERALFGLMALGEPRARRRRRRRRLGRNALARHRTRGRLRRSAPLKRRAPETAQPRLRVLAEVSVIELFREGYALAAALQSRAPRLMQNRVGRRPRKASKTSSTRRCARPSWPLLLPARLYVAFAEDEEAAAARDFRDAAPRSKRPA